MAYPPEIYKDFKKQYPDIARGYDALAKSCHEWGSLDAKCGSSSWAWQSD